jgi:hypothetical protein
MAFFGTLLKGGVSAIGLSTSLYFLMDYVKIVV